MGQGRKPSGSKVVERLDGSELAKDRLRVILDSLAGKKSIEEACQELGIGQAAFFKLRTRALSETMASLEPRPMGRPRKERKEEEEQVEALEKEVMRLKLELEAAWLREEIALAMPHLRKEKKR